MPFNEELLKKNRAMLGHFFSERRKEMGHSMEYAAKHIGISVNTLSRIESGRFAWDIDLHLKLCETYEIKPFYVPLELLKPDPGIEPEFLFCPNDADQELYILHRNYPECLIEVIQTLPASFEVKDIYGLATEEEVIQSGILEKAKKFFHEHIRKGNQN